MKLQSLQVARFAAAFMVVCHHTGFLLGEHSRRGLTTALAAYGWAGVDLFFVISGVVIAVSAKGLTWRQFVVKRCRRILPLYLGFAILAMGGLLLNGGVGWRYVIATFALWPATDRIVSPVVFGGWTLCFEALFYAATALVLWRPITLYLLLAAYALALFNPVVPVLRYLGNPIVLEFLAGVVIAHAPRPRWTVAALPVGIVLLAVLHPFAFQGAHSPAAMLAGQDMAGRVLIAGVPCALIIWGAMGIRRRAGLLTYLGDASYSIYLCHGPVLFGLMLVADGLAWIPADLLLIAFAAAAVVVGCRVYELFERPAHALLRRRPVLAPAV